MKKIFTLFTAALAALSVNAQDWNATNSGPLAKGTTILDNEYVTVVTAVQDSETALIKNETDQNDPKTYAGFTFTKYVNIRVTDAPAEANNWEGTEYADATPLGISLIVTAKKNTDMTLYYKHGDGKTLSCYDQTAKKAVSNAEKAVDGLAGYYTGTFQFIEGHKYTIYAKGGTTGLNGITTAAGTYVAPDASAAGTVIISWNDEPTLSSKTTEDMTNTGTSNNVATWDNGISIMIMRSDKGQSNGNAITVNGTSYKTIKVSNGAQNKLILPEGKVTSKITLYSYVNKDAATERASYWKEVAGATYTEETIFASYKDFENPDKREFTFDAANTVTFTNTGEQCCYVLFVEVSDGAAGITAAKAEIENGAIYNLAGQKVSDSYKGVVIMNGKKVLK